MAHSSLPQEASFRSFAARSKPWDAADIWACSVLGQQAIRGLTGLINRTNSEVHKEKICWADLAVDFHHAGSSHDLPSLGLQSLMWRRYVRRLPSARQFKPTVFHLNFAQAAQMTVKTRSGTIFAQQQPTAATRLFRQLSIQRVLRAYLNCIRVTLRERCTPGGVSDLSQLNDSTCASALRLWQPRCSGASQNGR